MAFSGIIPTIQVSSNSAVNNLVGGVVNNAIGGVVNVAIGSALNDQWRNTLGIPPLTPGGFLKSLASPSLITAGGQLLSSTVSQAISKSGALGFAGPLVQGLAEGAINQLTQGLLGSLNPAEQSEATKYFPGAGKEPDADYQGYAYNTGTNGPDLVFSIKPANSPAKEEVASQVAGSGEGQVQPTIPQNQAPATEPPPPAPEPNPAPLPGEKPLPIAEPRSLAVPTAPATPATPASTGGVAAAAATTGASAPSSEPTPTEVPQDKVWNFICAPQDISWSTSAQVDRVAIFGTNAPPVVSGSRGMRDLTISEALVEGFTRGKSVETKVSDLESLLNFSLDSLGSFVRVPVYNVYANDKRYGDIDGGCFVIKEINVKELLRDLKGYTTRAVVNVSLVQVPDYQVDDGRDQASSTVAGAVSPLQRISDKSSDSQRRVAAQANQGAIPAEPGEPVGDALKDPNMGRRVGY